MNNDILVIGSYPPPFGGQSVHIQSLYAYLKDDGFRVTVLNTGINKDIETDEIISVRSSRGLLKAVLFDKKSRVVHLHVSNVGDFGKLLPVFAASFLRKFRWVLTIHSGNIESTLYNPKASQQLLIKSMLSRVDKVICVNNTIRAVLSKWTNLEKLEVVPAFCIDFAVRKIPEEIEAFINAHDPIITCVGFYEPVYGLDLAILSMKQLAKIYPNAGLVIMGDKRNSRQYETMIEENRVGEHIFLCGNVNHDDCLSIMNNSTLFLRPTLYDGDAISVREALALGIPVIASDTEFRPAGVDVFKSGDLDAMVNKIILRLKHNGDKAGVIKNDLKNLEKIKGIYSNLFDSEQ